MPAKQTATVADVPAPEWEEIDPFTEPLELEIGDVVIGVYNGANEIQVNDPENPGEKRAVLLHELQTEPDTEPVGVWGSAVLDKRLAEVPIGSRVKIEYQGKQELDGGRTARRYKVWVDKAAAF